MEPTARRNSAPPEREELFFGYVALVCLGALAFAGTRLPELGTALRTAPVGYWLMAAFAVLTDARPFSPASRRQISPVYPSICFTFAILLTWGYTPALVVQAVAVGICAVRLRHRVWRAAFNASQYALAFAAAWAVLRATGVDPFAPGLGNAAAVLAAAGAWFVVNYLLVSVAVWLRFGGGWWQLLRTTALYETLSAGALLLLAPLLASAARLSDALIPFILVPLYAVNRMARLSARQAQVARRDPLTGLANRKALMSEVAEQLTEHAERAAEAAAGRAEGMATQLGLLILDLDRFKHVNDALGHEVGDRLLVEVSRRISAAVRPCDLVARLGGDEFAIVAPALGHVDDARALAGRIAEALAEPVSLDGLPLDVSGSIGVAVYPEHGADFATLMRHADVAMYDAKARGDVIAVYAPESDHNSPERLSLLADLRHALEDPDCVEVAFYYQPQVELRTGEVIGVEALLRWHHPVRGLVDPEELIRVAEHSGVMRLVTLRVVDDVVLQLAKWQSNGLRMRAAINVSVRDLHTGEIVDRLADRLIYHGVGADQIQLEITEGALMADPRRVMVTLRRLDRLGVALSLDDFGTGYSSMQHLRRLPLAEVKIDRSFVLGMTDDPDDEAIVRSIIELSGALGLRVVAEGVEDEATWRLLLAAGCHVAQGWYYARPMPPDQLVSWLSRYRPPHRMLPEARRWARSESK
ncbi:MAG TPA: EAL domain-containing protein [Rugosimonospora sp.]|nr:EAL domain-containing protein [Rugosimonospora sp.]